MSKKLSMYILTDTHFLSKDVWEEGEAINSREKGDQIAIKHSPEIITQFFNKIIEDKETEYVLITGDLINNGDLQSHKGFIKLLEKLTSNGKKVMVTCATHDYAGLGRDENIFTPTYYYKDRCENIEDVYKTDLLNLYYDFGPNYADSIHEESGSYSVSLPHGFRLIAICDNGNGRSHCGLFEDGFTWLENEIVKAHEKNEYVFLAVHHPVLPPWDLYKELFDFEMFGGYEKLSEMMCRYGVQLVFTGHTHMQNIRKYTDDKNRSFYDIATTATGAADGKMRKVVFDKDKCICKITSIGIESLDGVDTKGQSPRDYIYSLNFVGLLEKSLKLIDSDWNEFVKNIFHIVKADILKKHPHISKTAIKQFLKIKMSLVAKIGKKYTSYTIQETEYLKKLYLYRVIFTIVAHIYSGNAPYTPDTPEYKAITTAVKRLQDILLKFKFDINEKLPFKLSLEEILEPLLYNNRTGDDDNIEIELVI